MMKARLVLSSIALSLMVLTILGSLPNAGAVPEGFSVIVSPPRATIVADGTARFSVRISAVGTFSGEVRLATDEVPTGDFFSLVTSLDPASVEVPAGGSAYAVLTVHSSRTGQLTSGSVFARFSRHFTLTASSDNTQERQRVDLDFLPFTAGDFDVSVSPNSITLPSQLSETVNQHLQIHVTSRSDFPATVSATLHDPPQGLSWGFGPVERIVAPDGSASFDLDLVFTPTFLERSGIYRLAIGLNAPVRANNIGGGGAVGQTRFVITKTAILNIVMPPIFSISANPSIVNVKTAGETKVVNVVVSQISIGVSSPVTLKLDNIPEGVSAAFENPVVKPLSREQPAIAKLMLSVPLSSKSGVFEFKITGSGFGVVATTNITLVIDVLGEYDLSATPTSVELNSRSSSQVITISLTPRSGFGSTVHLSLANVPPGITATLATSDLAPEGGAPASTVLTLVADQDAAPGIYTISVVGSTGISSRSVAIQVTVRSGSLQLIPVAAIVVVLAVLAVVAIAIFPRRRSVNPYYGYGTYY